MNSSASSDESMDDKEVEEINRLRKETLAMLRAYQERTDRMVCRRRILLDLVEALNKNHDYAFISEISGLATALFESRAESTA